MFQISSSSMLKQYRNRNLCANLDSQDVFGNTLLHYAVMKDNYELVSDLLDIKDIDITLVNVEGKPSIFYIKTFDMMALFLDKLGPMIFTVFDSNRRNILAIDSIRQLYNNH
jgi:ankyrin repeat protein